MAKKATDLLDVFRLGSAEGTSRPTRSSSTGRRKSSKRRRPTSADSPQLGGRQLLLASCIGVLLIVLAFTVGLGVGRRGMSGATPSLDRRTTAPSLYWIRGELPSHDHLIDAPVSPNEVVRELQDVHKIPHDLVTIRRIPGSKFLQIDVGPFRTPAAAEDFGSLRRVKLIRLRNGSPFRFAKTVTGPGSR